MEKITLRRTALIFGGVVLLGGITWAAVAVTLSAWKSAQGLVDSEIDGTLSGQTPVDIVEDETTKPQQSQLYIELPEGIDGSKVSLSNDYLNQTIRVRFAEPIEDYAQNYRVHGSSDNISSLVYYIDGETGVLEIALDSVRELSYRYKDGYLCLNFPDPHELYDTVIVLDAGHGGRAVGAVREDVCEKDLNLAIVREIKALFDAAGDKKIKVYYTRTDDTNPSFEQRVGLANKSKADFFISIHHNSSGEGTNNGKQGTLVMYKPDSDENDSSRKLAQLCLEQVSSTAGSNPRKIAVGTKTHIIRNSEVPVALIEVGYMSNYEELQKLKTVEYQKLLAQGVYNALQQAIAEGL